MVGVCQRYCRRGGASLADRQPEHGCQSVLAGYAAHQCTRTRSATVHPRQRLTYCRLPTATCVAFWLESAASAFLSAHAATPNRAPSLPRSPATSPSRRGHDHCRQLTKTRAPNIGHSTLTQALLHPIAHRPHQPGTNALPGACAVQNHRTLALCPHLSPTPASLLPALPYKYPTNACPPLTSSATHTRTHTSSSPRSYLFPIYSRSLFHRPTAFCSYYLIDSRLLDGTPPSPRPPHPHSQPPHLPRIQGPCFSLPFCYCHIS